MTKNDVTNSTEVLILHEEIERLLKHYRSDSRGFGTISKWKEGFILLAR